MNEKRHDRRLDRGRATRHHLLDVATDLFAERGYEGTSTEAVLERAGVSRGSLYHHFPGKEALFEAVVASVHTRVGEATLAEAEALGDADVHTLLRTGYLAWVRLAGEPVVRQILLIDAPTVLGWRRWREMEEHYGLGMIKDVLQAAADQGRLPQPLIDPFAHMLLATGNELALLIALADDVPNAQASAGAAFDEFLTRILPPVDPAPVKSSDGTSPGSAA